MRCEWCASFNFSAFLSIFSVMKKKIAFLDYKIRISGTSLYLCWHFRLFHLNSKNNVHFFLPNQISNSNQNSRYCNALHCFALLCFYMQNDMTSMRLCVLIGTPHIRRLQAQNGTHNETVKCDISRQQRSGHMCEK